MNDQQLRELRAWARRLAADERADVRAAAKAIVMLADEVETLRERPAEEDEVVELEPDALGGATAVEVGSALRERLRSFSRARR